MLESVREKSTSRCSCCSSGSGGGVQPDEEA